MSVVKRFLQRRSSLNVAALLGLLGLMMPRIIEDIAQIKFIWTGKPWVDLTNAANISPNFLVWELVVVILDCLSIFFICWQALKTDKTIGY